MGHFEVFFGKEVEIFRALSDPLVAPELFSTV